MTIGSISSSTPAQPSAKTASSATDEAARGGKDVRNDGDADDAGAAAKVSAPKPVINTLGQSIGQNLNVQA